MPNTIPPNWQEKTLGEVCEIISGTTPDTKNSKYWDGSNYWITPAELSEEKIFITDCRRKITDLAIQHCSLRPMPKGTIIFSSRAPIGKVAISDVDTLYCNQGFKNFICSKSIYNKFLYYFLKLNTPLLISLGNGTTFKEISKSTISKVHIGFPSLPEQKRIVEKLDKIFANIDKAKEQTTQNIQNAQEMFEAFLNNIFTNTADNWEEKKLGEVIQLEYGKPLAPEDRDPEAQYPAYGANGIKTYTNKYLYDKPTIIVGRKGSAGEINLTTEKFWPLDVTYYIKFDNQKYDLLFLYFLLSSLNLPSLAKGVKPGINRNDVYSISCFFPALTEQQRIVKKLNTLSDKTRELKEICTKKLADLDELKQSVLQQAFSGKL